MKTRRRRASESSATAGVITDRGRIPAFCKRLQRGLQRGGRRKRDDDGPPSAAVSRLRDRRDVGPNTARRDAGGVQRSEGFRSHRLVRAAGHHHLAMVARSVPHDDRGAVAAQRLQLRLGFRSGRRQDSKRHHARFVRVLAPRQAGINLDDAAGSWRQFNSDSSGHRRLMLSTREPERRPEAHQQDTELPLALLSVRVRPPGSGQCESSMHRCAALHLLPLGCWVNMVDSTHGWQRSGLRR